MRSERNIARVLEAERSACKYWGYFSVIVSVRRCQERRDPWLSLARRLQISGIITQIIGLEPLTHSDEQVSVHESSHGPSGYQTGFTKRLECRFKFILNKHLRTPSLIHFSLNSRSLQGNQDEFNTTQRGLRLSAGASNYKPGDLQPSN